MPTLSIPNEHLEPLRNTIVVSAFLPRPFHRALRAAATATLICFIWASVSAQPVLEKGPGLSVPPSPIGKSDSRAAGAFPAWWGRTPVQPVLVPCREPGTCAQCHEAQARVDPSHAMPCTECHGGDPSADDEGKAHQGLVADPGDLRTVDRTCGKCHPEEARRVKQSSMALAPRMINHTRFAFGAQGTPASEHGTVAAEGVRQMPDATRSGSLADDLLRRSCLRCHLYTRGSTRSGEHRGQGCSACHVAYPNSDNERPRIHAIFRNVGMNPCIKCHNSNHVGADYVGLFEKDFHRGFRSPFVKGRQAPRIYGSEQHRLSTDVHLRAGMECMDCHTLDEVHGTGESSTSPYNRVTVSCEGCHVRGDHPAVLKQENGEMTLMRGQGRKIPARNPDIIPHQVEAHTKKLRCSACHAAWSFQDYGLHLMLEERADYWKWAPLSAQNDPQVQELLERYVGTYAELIQPQRGPLPARPMEEWKAPSARDWLTGEVRSGAWFRGYTARRWEDPPLGLDHRGRVSVLRPMYQHVISHVDTQENLLLDRKIPVTGAGRPALIVNPYAPHTIARAGRNCHECHGNPKAIGLGQGLMGIEKPGFKPTWKPEEQVPGHEFRWDAFVDEQGNPLQSSSHPSAGPLDRETVKKLMNPSDRHRAYWYRYLNREDARP